MHKQRRLFLQSTLISGIAWGCAAHASNYPDKPVTLIIPFGPGGATDSFVRALADKAARKLGQPIIIENKPGASGLLGANQVAKAKPDGYTITIAPDPVFTIPHIQKTQFDPLRDFAYIIQLSGYALGISTNASSKYQSWNDIVEDARKRPGEISYGTTGINGTMHLTMEDIARKLQIKLNHVAFKGEAEIINALMGNHIDLAITAGSIMPMVETRRARPLVVWTRKRLNKWPDTPTLQEIGIDLVATAPFGLIAPHGTSKEAIDKLHDAFKQALEHPDIKKLLETLNQESSYLSSDNYKKYAEEKFNISRNWIPPTK